MSKVAVVIPAYNEEKTISKVIKEVKDKVDVVIVVDDGSTDKTADLAKKERIILLRHIVNRGQGAALQTGTKYALMAGAEIIVHFDGDGQHIVEDIEKLAMPIIKKEVDIVLGTRFGTDNKIPFIKEIVILKPAIILNRLLTGLKLSDVHNGLRAFSRKAAEKIVITQDKMAHNTEITAQIKKNGLKWREVPVKIVYTEYGQGFCGGIEILKDLFWRKIV